MIVQTDRAEYQASYYKRNRAALRAKQAAYRAANADQINQRQADWRAANPSVGAASTDAWHALHPGKRAEAARRWKAANSAAVVLMEHNRRARIAGLTTVEFTVDQLAARRAYLGECCWICSTADDLTWDHVKPLSKGGAHMLANLRLACGSCNRIKNARWLGVGSLDALAELVRSRYQNINKVNGAAMQVGGIGR